MKSKAIIAIVMLVACKRHEPTSSTPSATIAPPPVATPSATSTSKTPCISSDEHDCMTKCDAGDMESCVRFGETLRFGDANNPRDEARGKTLLKRACDKNVGKACYFLSSPMSKTHDADVAKAKPLVVADCNAGDAASCGIAADIAMLAKNDAEQKRLQERANDLYARACNAGDWDSCGMAATAHVDTKDWAGMKVFAEKGCDHSDPDSCRWLASLYDEGLGVTADPKRARELFAKACHLGSSAGCDGPPKK